MSFVSASEVDNRILQFAVRRGATFLVVLAMHILIILLLVLSRPAVQPLAKQGSLSVFSLAAAPTAPPIAIPLPIVPTLAEPEITSPAIVFAEQQGAEGDPDGEACSPVDDITAQLANDPMVPVAISLVPQESRSVSEAIVMWNTEWSISAAEEDSPLAGVRTMILLTLEDMPPDCLAMPVVGPRLIPIATGDSTTFLAFGSGEWSWQQVIEPPDVLASEENEWTWEQLFDGKLPPML